METPKGKLTNKQGTAETKQYGDISFCLSFYLHKEPDLEAIAQREEENHVKAEERYREALKELKSQRLKEDERRNR